MCNAGRQQARASILELSSELKSLAKQLGPKGIRVNGVAPGQPAELASIYVQLAAEDASFTTGHVYGAAGGQGQP